MSRLWYAYWDLPKFFPNPTSIFFDLQICLVATLLGRILPTLLRVCRLVNQFLSRKARMDTSSCRRFKLWGSEQNQKSFRALTRLSCQCLETTFQLYGKLIIVPNNKAISYFNWDNSGRIPLDLKLLNFKILLILFATNFRNPHRGIAIYLCCRC